jgi:choline dehydrogenase-like flavoprotein
MLIDYNSEINNQNIPKVVILGSGPAGISLALSLEKKNISSLIIEAGEKEVSYKSQDFYKGEVVGQFPKNLDALRLRQFGGTSGHWGGSCRTLDSYDFDKWPIKKEDLDKYLSGACKILDIKEGPFLDSEVDSNLKNIEFRTSSVRFYEKYYQHLLNSKNIYYTLNTSIINFEINDNKVKSINCATKSGKSFKVQNKIFILACGGIENSRILKWSAFKDKENILNKLPIGNYFMEHPWKTVGYAIGSENEFKKVFKSSAVAFAPTEKFIKENKILNANFMLKMEGEKNDELKKICFELNSNNKLISYVEKTKDLCGSRIVSSWEQDPIIENRIELGNKKDPYGVPVPKIVYRKTKIMNETIRIILENLGETFIKKNIGRVAIEDFFYNDSKDFMTDSGYHHLGGTRMGVDPRNSVVDRNLKVHFLNNLYILGSSVFPTGGHANPTLSIVQLSLRLSKHLISNKII